MAATAQWYNDEKTTLIIEIPPKSTWDVFHDGVRQAHILIRQVSHNINLVIHPHGKLPDGNPLTHFRIAFNNQPANISKVIIVLPSDGSRAMVSFVKRLSEIIQKVYRTKSQTVFVSSLEEAVGQVKEPLAE